jgi:hypothetical protein
MNVTTMSVEEAILRAPQVVGDLLALAKFEPDADKRAAIINAVNLMQVFAALGMYVLKTAGSREELEATVARMVVRYLGDFQERITDAAKGPNAEWLDASKELLRVARSAPDLPAMKAALARLDAAPAPRAIPNNYVLSIAAVGTVAEAIMEGWMDWKAFDGPLDALKRNGYENW